ncbi:hypothetical protein Spb1_03540 [Planctopirus ephydatiae]|jgi:hypothetical protein|uniref:Uncharacterized protein n=1 Tax=Planctopirus ephydatiae TaxID=2528019 RepID=A0A518GIS1_9PLAN|nr:hypothetical protein [Planctopirus ephydatiae]QDV28491.1 hypothetical protein Spb1_03540 [Planctopirus ephydatiae]
MPQTMAIHTPAVLPAPLSFAESGLGIGGLRRWLSAMNARMFSGRLSVVYRRRASAIRHDSAIRSLALVDQVMTLATGISKRTRLSACTHALRLDGSLCLLSRTPLLKR